MAPRVGLGWDRLLWTHSIRVWALVKALVKAGLDRLKNQGANGCVVVGAKAFYGRFGFAQHEGLKINGVPPEY